VTSARKQFFHRGIAVPLLRPNIDTDAIIPSREIRRVSKEGLGEALFAGWRYRCAQSREPEPGFILNQAPYDNASILLAGDNFGCGSSREHAVWALKDFGFKAILAPSFGGIFFNNCALNGILTIELAEEAIARLAKWTGADPRGNPIEIDLAARRIHWGEGEETHFQIEAMRRSLLLDGLDSIAATLRMEAEIAAFEEKDRQRRPWVYEVENDSQGASAGTPSPLRGTPS